MRNVLVKTAMVALLGIGVEGCSSSGMSDSMSKDDMMTVVSSGDKDMMMAAPMDGMYMIMTPGESARPMFSTYLHKGDMLGFKTGDDGKMMAMAGDKSYDVSGMKGAMWVHGMAK